MQDINITNHEEALSDIFQEIGQAKLNKVTTDMASHGTMHYLDKDLKECHLKGESETVNIRRKVKLIMGRLFQFRGLLNGVGGGASKPGSLMEPASIKAENMQKVVFALAHSLPRGQSQHIKEIMTKGDHYNLVLEAMYVYVYTLQELVGLDPMCLFSADLQVFPFLASMDKPDQVDVVLAADEAHIRALQMSKYDQARRIVTIKDFLTAGQSSDNAFKFSKYDVILGSIEAHCYYIANSTNPIKNAFAGYTEQAPSVGSQSPSEVLYAVIFSDIMNNNLRGMEQTSRPDAISKVAEKAAKCIKRSYESYANKLKEDSLHQCMLRFKACQSYFSGKILVKRKQEFKLDVKGQVDFSFYTDELSAFIDKGVFEKASPDAPGQETPTMTEITICNKGSGDYEEITKEDITNEQVIAFLCYLNFLLDALLHHIPFASSIDQLKKKFAQDSFADIFPDKDADIDIFGFLSALPEARWEKDRDGDKYKTEIEYSSYNDPIFGAWATKAQRLYSQLTGQLQEFHTEVRSMNDQRAQAREDVALLDEGMFELYRSCSNSSHFVKISSYLPDLQWDLSKSFAFGSLNFTSGKIYDVDRKQNIISKLSEYNIEGINEMHRYKPPAFWEDLLLKVLQPCGFSFSDSKGCKLVTKDAIYSMQLQKQGSSIDDHLSEFIVDLVDLLKMTKEGSIYWDSKQQEQVTTIKVCVETFLMDTLEQKANTIRELMLDAYKALCPDSRFVDEDGLNERFNKVFYVNNIALKGKNGGVYKQLEEESSIKDLLEGNPWALQDAYEKIKVAGLRIESLVLLALHSGQLIAGDSSEYSYEFAVIGAENSFHYGKCLEKNIHKDATISLRPFQTNKQREQLKGVFDRLFSEEYMSHGFASKIKKYTDSSKILEDEALCLPERMLYLHGPASWFLHAQKKHGPDIEPLSRIAMRSLHNRFSQLAGFITVEPSDEWSAAFDTIRKGLDAIVNGDKSLDLEVKYQVFLKAEIFIMNSGSRQLLSLFHELPVQIDLWASTLSSYFLPDDVQILKRVNRSIQENLALVGKLEPFKKLSGSDVNASLERQEGVAIKLHVQVSELLEELIHVSHIITTALKMKEKELGASKSKPVGWADFYSAMGALSSIERNTDGNVILSPCFNKLSKAVLFEKPVSVLDSLSQGKELLFYQASLEKVENLVAKQEQTAEAYGPLLASIDVISPTGTRGSFKQLLDVMKFKPNILLDLNKPLIDAYMSPLGDFEVSTGELSAAKTEKFSGMFKSLASLLEQALLISSGFRAKNDIKEKIEEFKNVLKEDQQDETCVDLEKLSVTTSQQVGLELKRTYLDSYGTYFDEYMHQYGRVSSDTGGKVEGSEKFIDSEGKLKSAVIAMFACVMKIVSNISEEDWRECTNAKQEHEEKLKDQAANILKKDLALMATGYESAFEEEEKEEEKEEKGSVDNTLDMLKTSQQALPEKHSYAPAIQEAISAIEADNKKKDESFKKGAVMWQNLGNHASIMFPLRRFTRLKSRELLACARKLKREEIDSYHKAIQNSKDAGSKDTAALEEKLDSVLQDEQLKVVEEWKDMAYKLDNQCVKNMFVSEAEGFHKRKLESEENQGVTVIEKYVRGFLKRKTYLEQINKQAELSEMKIQAKASRDKLEEVQAELKQVKIELAESKKQGDQVKEQTTEASVDQGPLAVQAGDSGQACNANARMSPKLEVADHLFQKGREQGLEQLSEVQAQLAAVQAQLVAAQAATEDVRGNLGGQLQAASTELLAAQAETKSVSGDMEQLKQKRKAVVTGLRASLEAAQAETQSLREELQATQAKLQPTQPSATSVLSEKGNGADNAPQDALPESSSAGFFGNLQGQLSASQSQGEGNDPLNTSTNSAASVDTDIDLDDQHGPHGEPLDAGADDDHRDDGHSAQMSH